MNVMEFTQEHPQNFIKELKEVLTPYNTDASYEDNLNWGNSKWFLDYLNWINYLKWARNIKRIKYCDKCWKHKFIWMKNYDENQRYCDNCGYRY